MVTSRRYAHAPITEAVIEFRAQFADKPTLEKLQSVANQVAHSFPHRLEPALQFEVKAAADGEQFSATTGRHNIGYRLISDSSNRIAQVRPDLFAFSQMPPYTQWEAFRDAARDVWGVYRDQLRPTAITRVAVRYINQINIPTSSGNIELDDYFFAAPRVPAALPQVVQSYFVRMEIPVGEGGTLTLTLANRPPEEVGMVSAILDLDASFSDIEISDVDAWRKLEFLREKKNEAFEASITDRVRDLIS